MTPETIPVTLTYDWSPWGWWQVTKQDYEPGDQICYGETQAEALENYHEYLWDEGHENFILEVEGPTIEIQHKKYYV